MAPFQGFIVPVNQFIHDRVSGLVSLMGLFDQLNFSALPASGQIRVGGRIWGGPGGQHAFHVEVLDPAGEVVGRSGGHEFQAPETGGVQHTYGIDVPLSADRAGLFQLKLFVDGVAVGSHPIVLAQG